MCGIAGLFHFDPDRSVDPGVLDRMTDVLAHRGPDGRGTYVDGGLGLGHRRLAIIDLSEDGAQPMSNEDGTVWVVLNGEIYNFAELRRELEGRGHRFRSRTDTEVLVHLYEEEGPGLVQRLRGMFAFALWDGRRRKLLLARDRFGQKPLVYRLDRLGVRFASELKGILADPEVERVPDPIALDQFLTFGYVPAPRTAFEGIRKLPAGHLLEVEADGRAALRCYWRLELSPKRAVASRADEARAAEELLGRLDEAVRLRLVADVPLGAFLSGGLDSSAVVASMCAVAGRPASDVRTFSIGFDRPEYDESGEARRVAAHLGTDHTTLQLTPGAFVGIEQVVWHHGEPFADSSALPTFAVSALARPHVTVALTGDGADELFCGYTRYAATRVEERVRSLPLVPTGLLLNRVGVELVRRSGRHGLAAELARAFSAGSSRARPVELYASRMELLDPELRARLYGAGLRGGAAGADPRDVLRAAIAASAGETFTERCAHADAVTYLPDDVLAKVDIASMAYGLECRSPFLDHELAEFVGRLPFRLKMRRLETKLLLRRAVGPRLPRETLGRSKMGFGVPLEHWFRGALDAELEDVLRSRALRERGLVEPWAVDEVLAEHRSGQADRRNELYALLVLELWHRLYIDPPQGTELPTRAAAPIRLESAPVRSASAATRPH